MAKTVKVRHTITGLTEEMSQEYFESIAFTSLHKVFEVLPDDYDVNCTDCGQTAEDNIEEDEELDLGDGYDFYDNEEEDYNRG